jgi:hypothetical protein
MHTTVPAPPAPLSAISVTLQLFGNDLQEGTFFYPLSLFSCFSFVVVAVVLAQFLSLLACLFAV